jgi:hypothetical protein
MNPSPWEADGKGDSGENETKGGGKTKTRFREE